MRQFKSDGRYNYHSQGLCYIVEFRWNNRDDRILYSQLQQAFEDMLGEERFQVTDLRGYVVWQRNKEWRSERNFKAKRLRIYLRDESVLTMALLRIS